MSIHVVWNLKVEIIHNSQKKRKKIAEKPCYMNWNILMTFIFIKTGKHM